MSALTEYTDVVKAAFEVIAEGVTGISEDIALLKSQIETLKTSTTISEEDKAILEELTLQASSIAEKVTALDASTPLPTVEG